MTNLNPLNQEFRNFDHAVPFSQIRTEHFLPGLEVALNKAKKNIQAIKENRQAPDFKNTILALESCSDELDRLVSIYSNIENANGSEEHRALAKEIYPLLSSFSSDISLDPELFEKIKSVHDQMDSLSLSTEERKLLEKTYLSFVRNGALLGEEDKKKMREIDHQLSLLSPEFSDHVLNSTNAFELVVETKKDLDGLPEGAIEAAASLAESKGLSGKWMFNLQVPSFMPLVTYCKNRLLREKIWRAYNSRAFQGKFDNQEIIKKTVRLRHERAQLLGFKTHADYVLAERMAQSTSAVNEFLNKLLKACKSAAQRDLDEVRQLALHTDNLKDFQPWDFAYYSEKLKEQKYSFNEESLRPYFKLENVVAGVFEHARKLYSLSFKENSQIETYHPDVKVYEVSDSQTGQYVGLFYTDFFPREAKRGGAWMTTFREQGYTFGQIRRPHVSIVCNFTQPTATKPSLLTYDEVRTLFHEFGHALHGLLSQCQFRSLAGTNVYWDFVELPSQIMENWVGEKEGLDVFARHFETNELIPADLVQKIKDSSKFLAGWQGLRQLQFSSLDMKWHSCDPASVSDVDQFETEATVETRLLPKVPGTNTSCAFSHIFAGGYSAGYYSYKWAEVLDADAFEYFKEMGLFNAEVAKKFKDHILSRGGSEHPMDLYKKFRGREPDPNALLRRDGLV